MQVQEIKDYCMSKPLAFEDCPLVQQPYWNTVFLNDSPDEELLNMIDLAYDTVFSKFSKKEQKRILEEL